MPKFLLDSLDVLSTVQLRLQDTKLQIFRLRMYHILVNRRKMVLGFYNSIVPLFSYEIPRLLKSSKTNRDNGEFIQRFYFISDPNLDNSPDNTA